VYAALRTLGVISKQTILLRKSVEAAQSSAIAAIENVRVIKDKERARITIEPGEVKLGTPQEPWKYKVFYKAFCAGTTPAYIQNSTVMARISNHEKAENDLAGSVPMKLGTILSPGGRIHSTFVFDLPQTDITDAIQNGDLFVHFYALISYEDIFGDKRQELVRYVYGNPRGIFLPALQPYWKVVEPEDGGGKELKTGAET